ncbi:MAG: hypothetical protein IJQ18_09215 [Paludibacteraceae bacterium]|nr:hypothetical protein [Paludibacteraceae bacterium]
MSFAQQCERTFGGRSVLPLSEGAASAEDGLHYLFTRNVLPLSEGVASAEDGVQPPHNTSSCPSLFVSLSLRVPLSPTVPRRSPDSRPTVARRQNDSRPSVNSL